MHNLIVLKVEMICNSYYDTYSLDFGIRSITWSTTANSTKGWKINSEPFYCSGVNRHEDFPVNN